MDGGVYIEVSKETRFDGAYIGIEISDERDLELHRYTYSFSESPSTRLQAERPTSDCVSFDAYRLICRPEMAFHSWIPQPNMIILLPPHLPTTRYGAE